jgi:hypothetical protein
VYRLTLLFILAAVTCAVFASSALAGGAGGCVPTLPGANACGLFVKGQTYGDYAIYTGTSTETGQPTYLRCNECEPTTSSRAGVYLSPGGDLNVSQAGGLKVIGGGLELSFRNPLGSAMSLAVPFGRLPDFTVLRSRNFCIWLGGKPLHGRFVDAWVDLYVPQDPLPEASTPPAEG